MINFANLFRPFLQRFGLMQPTALPEDLDLSMKPVSPDILYKKLKRGKVNFSFKKKDGTLRLAHGTLKMRYVPSEHHPQGIKEPSPKVVTYFDLVKKQWRSVSVEQEIYIQP